MKTFITTILCVWASSTFALTSSTSVIKRSEVKTVEQRHHKEQPSRRHSAMNEKDFQFLYKIIKKKSFDDDRMEILSVGVLDNYFTCQQCVRLMSLYKFDDDKLKILRIMSGHIVDLENHHDILMRLDFESNKLKALNILGIRHERVGGRL
jgi:hypothetical protein